MKKANETFILNFPADSGFNSTEINFYNGSVDLVSLYLNEQTSVNRLFVTDETIAKLDALKPFVSYFTDSVERKAYRRGNDVFLILGPGEAYKTIESVLAICSAALDANFNRNCLFVAIGGGVITDMTGFAASMFKRGVDVEFVSTTLLADVDAAIGGKTGCDFYSYKNMIGAFYPSKKLHLFPSFVKTLSDKEFKSGLAEALKTAFLFSKEMTELFRTEKEKIINRDDDTIAKIITECAKAKAAVVHKDFKEKGDRAFLNLGHTFGHAAESVAGLGEITHGEGVAWGMSRACDLALNKGLCTKEFAQDCKHILSLYGYDINPVPECIKDKENVSELLVQAMHKDKKNTKSGVTRCTVQISEQTTKVIEATDEELLEVLK